MIGLIDDALRPRDNEVQPVVAHVLEAELVGRLLVESGEVGDGVGVDLLRVRRHVAERHVVDHALPQRRYLLGHRCAPVEEEPHAAPTTVTARLRRRGRGR